MGMRSKVCRNRYVEDLLPGTGCVGSPEKLVGHSKADRRGRRGLGGGAPTAPHLCF